MNRPNDLQAPLARNDGVLVEHLDAETMLFDSVTNRYVALNDTAAYVWGLCDGTRTVAEIIVAFQREHAVEDGRDVVWLALDLLVDNGLLANDFALPGDGAEADRPAMSRRAALVAAAGLVALPLVTSLVAPAPAAAQSGGPGGDPPGPLDPHDCVVSAWGAWSACSKTCGGGVQTRTRTVITPAINGGAPCPPLVETRPCSTIPCPQDCVLSAWSEWSACSASCGGGVRTRTRTVITPAAHGGAPCGPLVEYASCNEQPCPVDCVMGPWGPWSPCSGGTQTRTRAILTPAAHGGAPCGVTVETRSCL